ncbi:hypothetical protein GOP47_0025506, partial [Adiantum capillus-veneris]
DECASIRLTRIPRLLVQCRRVVKTKSARSNILLLRRYTIKSFFKSLLMVSNLLPCLLLNCDKAIIYRSLIDLRRKSLSICRGRRKILLY